MKTLKITVLVLATAISSFYATAQDEVMHVSLKNGKTAQYAVGEINNITFGEALPDGHHQSTAMNTLTLGCRAA